MIVAVSKGEQKRFPALYRNTNTGSVWIALDERGPAICIKSSPDFPSGYGVGDKSVVFDENCGWVQRLAPGEAVTLRNTV